jgi:hypothetical protein
VRVWGRHPAELAGHPYEPWMLDDVMALRALDCERVNEEENALGALVQLLYLEMI